jgi:hypothetical protein
MKIKEVCLDTKSLTEREDMQEESYPVHQLAGTVSWKVSYLLNKTGSVRINITLSHVCATVVAVEKQFVLHILIMCL